MIGLERKNTLYLAKKTINGQTHYFIRESYLKDRHFLSRNLFDLGTDPSRFIVYPGGNSFYIHESVEERLDELNVHAEYQEVEDIFWRFLDPEIRKALETFRNRQKRLKTRLADKHGKTPAPDHFHIFDRRRILYLKCGQTDQRNIAGVPDRLFRELKGKSRDEIEQMIMEMENILVAREYRTYTHTIFNLQNFFHQWFAQSAPKLLDQNKVDEHFMEEICRLNSDTTFWSGMEFDSGLHEYLVRYICMYFDYDYAPKSFIDAYVQNFINSRRAYRPPSKSQKATLDEAGNLFEKTPLELKTMSRKELVRLYRQRVQKCHPDKGGDPKKFIKLTRRYHDLLKSKS